MHTQKHLPDSRRSPFRLSLNSSRRTPQNRIPNQFYKRPTQTPSRSLGIIFVCARARGINCRTSGTCTAVVRGGSVIMPEEPSTTTQVSSRPRKWKKYNWLSYDRERLPKVSSSAARALRPSPAESEEREFCSTTRKKNVLIHHHRHRVLTVERLRFSRA